MDSPFHLCLDSSVVRPLLFLFSRPVLGAFFSAMPLPAFLSPSQFFALSFYISLFLFLSLSISARSEVFSFRC